MHLFYVIPRINASWLKSRETCTHLQLININIGDSCSWLTPTNQNSTLQCVDGTFCNWETNLDGNRCCNSHQGRSKCPKNYPMMCASRVCAGVRDYCCSSNGCKASGRRLCGKRTSVRPAEIHDGLKSIYKSLLNSKSTSRKALLLFYIAILLRHFIIEFTSKRLFY
jgi:hypothetical protein